MLHRGIQCPRAASLLARADATLRRHLPRPLLALQRSSYAVLTGFAGVFIGVVACLVLLARHLLLATDRTSFGEIDVLLSVVFAAALLVTGIASWLVMPTEERQSASSEERDRQTNLLLAEIRAHKRTDAELQRALERADAANQAKSRYVAGISHELRTPLNAILGYAQLLERDPTMPAHAASAMRVVRRSSEHLADLVEGLLDISKIEAGKLELARGETFFVELLDQIAAIFRMQAEEKGLGFHYEVEGRLPERVYADEKRLRQILTNLLSNAIRYTDRGSVRFRVRFSSDVATFSVEDTGRGIPEHARERIFEPFERLEASTVPGTGLGLTITRLLVDVQGGDLQLQSRPGEGSVFVARLMLPRVHDARPLKARRRIYGYKGKRRRILIVDDNADHRDLLENVLRPIGFDLAMAESGEAALAIAGSCSVDMALIDVSMPGMSGWALAERLRRESRLGAPIIMLSAHAGPLSEGHQGIAHHDDFLTKPLNLDVLLSRLERFLDIDWRTEAAAGATGRDAVSGAGLPQQTLEALTDLVEIGHVRGLERELGELAASSAAHGPFVTRAQELLELLDFDGLKELVGKAANGTS